MNYYNIERQRRKTIKIFIKNGIVTVIAPVKTDNIFIENAVNKFYLKYNDEIKKTKELSTKQYIFIFGIKTNIKDFNINKLNYLDIKKIFEFNYKQLILKKINSINQLINANYMEIKFRKLKSKWGSLDSKGRLKFNYLLFMLEPDLIEYLIIHELCHFKFFNHSRQFWNEVAKFLPDYKIKRKRLKESGWIIDVFN
jgi:hypothetical protein